MLEDLQLNDEELHLYSRHILLEDWDLEAQQKLKCSRVLMIGAGGIGATAAELLIRAGVGHLTIVDFDVIETSNLQRQIAFLPQDVGNSKVETLARRLKKINPHVEIIGINQRFDDLFIQAQQAKYDLVMDGCDNFATRYLVNDYCIKKQIPLLSAAAIGYEGQLMFVQQQPCYACVFPQEDHTQDDRRCANSGVLTTTPVIMASLQAHHALLYLGQTKSPLLNKLLLWDGRRMQQKTVQIQADMQCKCAKH